MNINLFQLIKFNVIIFLYFFASVAFSQNFKWLKGYAARNKSDFIHGIEPDSNKIYALLSSELFGDETIDTLKLGSQEYIIGEGRFSFIIVVDSMGYVVMSKSIGNFHSRKLIADKSGGFYVSGWVNDTGKTMIDSFETNISKGKSFIAKFNRKLELVWVSQFGNSTTTIQGLSFTNGKIMFIAESLGKVKFGNDSFEFNNSINSFFGEYDLNLGSNKWINIIVKSSSSSNTSDFRIKQIQSLENRFYISVTSNSNYVIQGDTLFRGSNILRTDSVGNYIKAQKKLKTYTEFDEFLLVGDKFYFTSTFIDSIKWGNNKFGPYRSQNNTPIVYIAALDTAFNELWLLPIRLNGDKVLLNGSRLFSLSFNNGFLYCGGVLSYNGFVGEYLINTRDYLATNIFLKSDLIGNILWVANGGVSNSIRYIQSDGKSSVYGSGQFSDTLRYGDLEIIPYKGRPDAFITRLSDNAIIRGEVSPGPYCAGDTFKVPYKKIGDYDTSNYFIAELSDADGNFTGEHRELGRIKTNKDSVVLGKLPLFQVSSSEKYRIRILSTAPAVQSYFKFDTLRLLIYSKDKADAGRDTLICKGDSLKLQTFGGTKWTWSPKYKMFDSTARETMVWPDKTTTYTIIIADSSGCGQADTSSKTVFVRNKLSVQFHTPKDTNVCLNGTMPLIVSFHGGDSTGYNWQWTAIDSKNNYYFPKSGSGKLRDTLIYTLPTTEKDSIQFSIFLSDGCTPKPAFGLYTLNVKKNKTTATFKENDTTACPGKMIPVVANFKGSSAALLSWQWQEANTFNQWINRKAASNKQADTFNYTLPLNWKGDKRLRVILKDNCSGLNDTAIYTITPRDTLQLTLNTNDTTLCKGQTYTYKASARDGYSAGYQFVWIDTQTGDTLTTKDSFKLLATQNQTIKVTLYDGCMPNAISRIFNVTVNPELSSEIRLINTSTKANDTVLCYGQSIEYQAQTTGGIGTNYSYLWKLNGIEISTQNSLEITENDYKQLAGSNIRLQLIISDGCTVINDSNELNIEILEPISQTTNYTDSICYETSNNFKTTAQGGTGNYSYMWIDNTNTTISTLDNYNFNHNTNQTGTKNIKVIVSDPCSENDTAEISTILLAPLNVTITASDPCPVNALTLTANATGGKTTKLQINWFENSSQIGTGNSITINTQGIPKTITAIVTDGCSKADTQNFSTGSRPGIKLEANNICLGDETSFIARSTNASKADTYQWKIDGVLQSETDSILKNKFAGVGKYKILVTASNNGTCQGLDSINLEILPRPEAAFDFIHFKSQGNLIPFSFKNRSQKESNWYWDFGTGDTSMLQDPNYSYTDTGKFWVQLIVGRQGKCFDTTKQLVPVYHDITFYFPNVFSPNGNSINETFGLSGGQWFKVSTYTLKIYNRWGELMFSTDQMQEQWTGEGAQQSVYIYTAEIRDVYNVLHKIEGVVELLR